MGCPLGLPPPFFACYNVGMSEIKKLPWRQFGLLDLFVLTTLAGIGIVVYQFGIALRPRAVLAVAMVALGGALLTFVAYFIPSKNRTTTDLFLGVTFLVMGIGGLVGIFKPNWHVPSYGWVFGVLYGSGALIGAGLFSPSRQKTLGAVLGFLLIYPAMRLLLYLLG